MGVFFFFLPLSPPTGSDLQCSASLLLRRFSHFSESCFSSELGGRQQSVKTIRFFPRSIREHLQRRAFSLVLLFGFLKLEISSNITAESQTSCTTTLGAFSETLFLSIIFFLNLSAVFPWIVAVYSCLTDWIAALDFADSRLDFGDSSSSSSSPTQPLL